MQNSPDKSKDTQELLEVKPSNRLPFSEKEIINDYKICFQSRQASILGRKEVFLGRAMFGIFGDGKEVPQIALAKAFKEGDWRAGYYRDQTLMFAKGASNIREFFSQLYAHSDTAFDSHCGGRQMTCHYATRFINPDGTWKDQTKMFNTSADISSTASQMPRLVGLAYASKLYRQIPELAGNTKFSDKGNEVAFGTIGDASTSEGLFFEAINAAGVLQIPLVISVWDDGYGISVPQKYQTTKESISEILKGFQRDEKGEGFDIYVVKGWDYPTLCDTYMKAVDKVRKKHIPAIFHITELTQPQGHSTSGSHERYKSKERLEWEREHDCLSKMREWMLSENVIAETELVQMESEWKSEVSNLKLSAFNSYISTIKTELEELVTIGKQIASESKNSGFIGEILKQLKAIPEPLRRDVMMSAKKIERKLKNEKINSRSLLATWLEKQNTANTRRYNSFLTAETPESANNVNEIKPVYSEHSPLVTGAELLNACFEKALTRDSRIFAIGEDVGRIGDVDQGFAGMQAKFGEHRVTDTGIREATILGQGIGAALRGLRPIIEIQYLDYLLYALQTMSDDLACLHFRTCGGQKAPVIIRTRGHRLVGIWHSGSPMGMIINSIRGMHVLVPRNMTQAVGFYNTLLQSDDPALMIEVLSGYRLKEKMPDNVGNYTVPLGVPEILREGSDVTVVTYAVCCKVALEAAEWLADAGISVEVIDVQTLLPFDRQNKILESVKKTNRVVFLDEDVPGGASAYMMQKVLEEQNAYTYLDSAPLTITAKEHRTPYGRDGDYFSKPNADLVYEVIYRMMNEVEPGRFPG